MFSLMQYRKIGLAARKQVQRHHEAANYNSSQLHSAPGVSPPDRCVIGTTPNTPAFSADNSTAEPDGLALAQSQDSSLTALGHALTGINAREKNADEGTSGKVFVVDWEGDHDPLNPRNWSITYRVWLTLIVASISFVVGAASSTDTAILPQAAADFGVSEVVESLTIGIYLIGYAVGAVFAGPFSETFGRNAVYISTMILFMIFLMASALAPNIGAQLAFRFLAGVFGAPPLTCGGGSMADLWSPIEKTYGFPIFAITGFWGPVVGPVIGSYIAHLGSWRWAEWIILIIAAIVLALIVFFMPETYPPFLLKWKAEHLRHETGDERFRAEMEVVQSSLLTRLKVALTRPVFFAFEPIVLLMTLHLTILYIVLFTFLDGYPYIFSRVYGTSQSLTNVIFTAMAVGIALASLTVPWIYKITKESFAKNAFVPELRLWFAMLGAPAIPISLFWMGWTDFASISIWSPIMASVLLGYGIISIFISTYMYIIDSYEFFAASALTFVTLVRYTAAGGMTVVGGPFYKNMGPHYTLTILGCISVLMTPIPYVFYRYGHKLRVRSKRVVSKA